MAIRLLVVLVVILLIHLLPHMPKYRRHGWFHRWTDHHAGSDGAAFVAWTLLPPLILCAVVSFVLSQIPLMTALWGLFAGCVLAYSLGPRDLERDIDAVLKAGDRESREAAAQALRATDDRAPLPFSAPCLVEATVWAGLRRRFSVIFWFLLLGPTGALGYRLARLLLIDHAPDEDADQDDDTSSPARRRAAARRLGELLDWPAAHLMVLAMALVSDFDAVTKAWRAWHADAGNAARNFDPGFLGAVARASVDADVQAGDAGTEDTSDVLVELGDARRLLRRVLVVWLAVAALIVLGGWFV
ncbi:membrane protein [Oleiagrimonas citrea]|uniref:Beta-lactamase induction protein n=1 Tax=Oleiagrimonas citrea TaxID=1665687 RepID=A0A846ZR02_9GAMM|nr:beta-lactamase induction protein [Oleiagrimonas citrea]NKZ39831.1 beta-lactamase induction protein [Oleiagrimonas citrea]